MFGKSSPQIQSVKGHLVLLHCNVVEQHNQLNVWNDEISIWEQLYGH